MDDFKKFKEEILAEIKALDERIDDLEDESIENRVTVRNILDRLKEINDDTKWVRRTLASLLIGGAISAFVSLIVYFVQN